MMLNFLRVSVFTGLVILALLLFFRRRGQKYAANLKYWVWILLTVRLLVPVPINLTLPSQAAQIPVVRELASAPQVIQENQITEYDIVPVTELGTQEGEESTIAARASVDAVQSVEPQAAETTDSRLPDMASVLAIVWAIGAVGFLAYHFLANLAFRRRVCRWGRPARDQALRTLVARAKKNTGVKGSLRLLILKDAASPMVMGFFHPTLILPQERWDATELYYVLRHEMTHLRRKDVLYKFLLLLANGLHWFNPAVWLLRARACQDLEITCDMAVMDGATRDVRVRYCETIMATAERSARMGYGMASTFGSTKKSIMERFQEIFTAAERKKGTAVLVIVLLVAILGCCSIGIAASSGSPEPLPEVSVVEEPAPAAASEGEESSPAEALEQQESALERQEQELIREKGGMLMNNPHFDISVFVPDSACEYISMDEEFCMYCIKDGVTLWSISEISLADYLWSYDHSYPEWPGEPFGGNTYLIGQGTDVMYLLGDYQNGTIPESQEIIADFLERNDIVTNPVCTSPHYKVGTVNTEESEGLAEDHVVWEDALVTTDGIKLGMYSGEVLALLGTPDSDEVYSINQDDAYRQMLYGEKMFNFALCADCRQYHLVGISSQAESAVHMPLGFDYGVSLETVLSYFDAVDSVPAIGNKLYYVDSWHYAVYEPLADTGLVSIRIYAGDYYWDIGFSRNQTIHYSNLEYVDIMVPGHTEASGQGNYEIVAEILKAEGIPYDRNSYVTESEPAPTTTPVPTPVPTPTPTPVPTPTPTPDPTPTPTPEPTPTPTPTVQESQPPSPTPGSIEPSPAVAE